MKAFERAMAIGILTASVFAGSSSVAQPEPAPPAQDKAPGARPKLQARPLTVKGPAPGAGQTAQVPSVTVPSAPQNTQAVAASAPPRLSDAPPDRLSPLCRTAAQKLLLHRRRETPLSEVDQQEQNDFRTMHLDCFNATGASLTSGSAGVGEEIVRSVAQVVLKRAQSASWRILQSKLLQSAGCDEPAPAGRTLSFPETCRALRSLPINDLVSSPAVLIDAVIADFFVLARPPEKAPWLRIPILDEALREAAVRFRQSGASGLAGGFAQIVRRRMKEQVAKADCEMAKDAPDKALWVSGMCLIEAQAPANFGKCDVDGWASQCTDEITTQRILQLWTLMNKIIGAPERAPLSAYVDFICTSAEIAIDEAPDIPDARRREAHDYVDGMRAVFGGIGHKDWIETTSGAVRVLRLVVTTAMCEGDPESQTCKDAEAAEKLFTLLAAVGNYAETFSSGAKDGASAREKILEDLVSRMVDRAHRDSGWVVSAGGSLSLFGGARTDFSGGMQVAFPVQLGLGLGIQSYGAKDRGFHAMVSALDLGQYITFSSTDLTVSPPALESSVVLGLSLGGWVALRETPLFISAYGGVSPFVKAEDRPTFQLGLSTGLYVPLIDFN